MLTLHAHINTEGNAKGYEMLKRNLITETCLHADTCLPFRCCEENNSVSTNESWNCFVAKHFTNYIFLITLHKHK